MTDLEVFDGEVIWFSNGFGFLSWEKDGVKQPDMFTHFSDIQIQGFKLLKAGQKVSFSIGQNNAGKPKAIEVKVIG
jgi:CspA family cold shock protein